jgi:hypothetical protein
MKRSGWQAKIDVLPTEDCVNRKIWTEGLLVEMRARFRSRVDCVLNGTVNNQHNPGIYRHKRRLMTSQKSTNSTFGVKVNADDL